MYFDKDIQQSNYDIQKHLLIMMYKSLIMTYMILGGVYFVVKKHNKRIYLRYSMQKLH